MLKYTDFCYRHGPGGRDRIVSAISLHLPGSLGVLASLRHGIHDLGVHDCILDGHPLPRPFFSETNMLSATTPVLRSSFLSFC